jgi:hypothetical protein
METCPTTAFVIARSRSRERSVAGGDEAISFYSGELPARDEILHSRQATIIPRQTPKGKDERHHTGFDGRVVHDFLLLHVNSL